MDTEPRRKRGRPRKPESERRLRRRGRADPRSGPPRDDVRGSVATEMLDPDFDGADVDVATLIRVARSK